eukprot:PhF_6_TR5269/c0_g1_i2/m.7670/K07964/HPSE; heparanase
MFLTALLIANITFQHLQPQHTTGPTYLSFNIDTGSLYNNFDFSDPIFTQLVKNLASASPMQIRIGGGAAENTMWTGVGGPRANCSVPGNYSKVVNICLDSTYLDEICTFARQTGVRGIVWDFNAALRLGTPGPWNSTNAIAMLEYLNQKALGGNPCPIAAWQLGNEVEDSDMHDSSNITGADLARDFHTLRSILQTMPQLSQVIYGPDSCCEAPFNGSFLEQFTADAIGALDAVTVHEYPIPRWANNSCIPQYYTNKSVIQSNFQESLSNYTLWSQPALKRGVPLILGEVATSAHGGCDGMSNRFIASFTFLMELSMVAENGYVQLNRQDIAGWSSQSALSYYALLGPGGWSRGPLGPPHPDYFLAILFKQLISNRVLQSSATTTFSGDLWDSHVWCARGISGGIVVTFMNMQSQSVRMVMNTAANVSTLPRTEYVLTSPAGLDADAVNLNGKTMTVNPDGTLPRYPIPGRNVVKGEGSGDISIPPWSLGFMVFPKASVAACKG